MADFKSILDRDSKDVERPKPLPVGSYIFVIPELFTTAEIGKNKTPAVNFKARVVSPGADVDMEAVMAIKGGVQGKEMRMTFFLTEDAEWRLKEFLEDSLGIESGKFSAMLPQTVNKMFTGVVSHRVSDDGQQVYAEIKSTSRA